MESEVISRKDEEKTEEKEAEEYKDLKERRERHPERYLAHTFLTFKETILEADRGKWIDAIERE